MVGKIAKMIAYTKAPKSMFALLHPVRAAKMGLSYLVVRKALHK